MVVDPFGHVVGAAKSDREKHELTMLALDCDVTDGKP
jgi:hypothetical protein